MCKRNRLYRVYIRPDELVFIWAGSGSEGVAGARAGGAAHGALGALIGALFAKMLDPSKKNAARKAVLDSTPLDDLIEDNPMNLRALLREFEEVRIGPRSARHAAGYADHDHQALLYLRHQSLGKYRLGIASVEDVAVALRELPRIFGSLCQVEIQWSERQKKYVQLEGRGR
jgi:hypothetical protein